MNCVTGSVGSIDYMPCRYGGSKLLFRGPRQRLDGAYVAVLGGTETYGRFVERPYPALAEAATGLKMVNLGYLNAGVDVFLQDRAVMELCAGAEATVIQLLGAQNLSNGFYSVHPRRNDRFLGASPRLKSLFRDVDFTEFNFTRHLLAALEERSAERFAVVVAELRAAWSDRMTHLLRSVGGRKILLWIGEEPPGDGGPLSAHAPDPLFVTRGMIDALGPMVAELVEVVVSAQARAAGTAGMVFGPTEEGAAQSTTNLAVHRDVAGALAASLDRVLG
jgi:hypothetical protein